MYLVSTHQQRLKRDDGIQKIFQMIANRLGPTMNHQNITPRLYPYTFLGANTRNLMFQNFIKFHL